MRQTFHIVSISMTRAPLADGLPITGDVVVVADESTPESRGGVAYVLAAAAMPDHSCVQARLDALFDDERRRPFHWVKEGSRTRERMVDVISESGLVAAAYVRVVGRRDQRETRRELIAMLSKFAEREGTEHLIIEASDEATMGRDRAVLLDSHRSLGGVPYAYDWRSKREPLVWIADAIAGLTGEWATGRGHRFFERLSNAGVLTAQYV